MPTDRQQTLGAFNESSNSSNAPEPLAKRVLALPSNGKITITHLVDEGLLTPGNVVVCNNWPFVCVVTESGTFEARWEPLPADFITSYGMEFMRSEFETPSAWATAVCRVMRAQVRAQRFHKPTNDEPPAWIEGHGRRATARRGSTKATGSVGEGRVAVNGWTACRVLITPQDPNHSLAVRLEAESRAEGSVRASSLRQIPELASVEIANVDGDVHGDTILEISLDTLRRELCSRINRTRAAKRIRDTQHRQSREEPMAEDPCEMDNESTQSDTDSEQNDENPDNKGNASPESVSELSGAVEGLARRVESDLALGCVRQRRAAAAAADAISATANASSMALYMQVAAHAGEPESASFPRKGHGRKRKSIPDMSRHAKLSRTPGNAEPIDDDLDESTSEQLAVFQVAINSRERSQTELKSLRYQRRQQLKRRVSRALGTWLLQRQKAHTHRLAAPPTTLASMSTEELPTVSSFPLKAEPLTAPAYARQYSEPDLSNPLMSKSIVPMSGISELFCVPVPRSTIDSAHGLCLCAHCGSTETADIVACKACGDIYHRFCLSSSQQRTVVEDQFLCSACRACNVCLDKESPEPLLLCDECGIQVHAGCSQQSAHGKDGLLGAVARAGRWVCDECIQCLECGFTMAKCDKSGGDDIAIRTQWEYDFSVCGTCAQQFERAKVCPVCIATYSNCEVSANMVCCDLCAAWVHAECDPRLTPEVYEALISLEDAPYACPACCEDAARHGPAINILESVYSNDKSSGLPRCLASYSAKSDKQEPLLKDSSADMRMSNPGIDCMALVSRHDYGNTIEGAGTISAASIPPADMKLPLNDAISKSIMALSDTATSTEPETEIANMLLRLTQSDIRFDNSQFSVSALESRFCEQPPSDEARDWRSCTLCGLHGDGVNAHSGPQLGRLVPLYNPTNKGKRATGQWAHTECLEWAWGPRSVRTDESDMSYIRIEGQLFDGNGDDIMCTLCGRMRASFHCCAPVPCPDTAYHLPCLLLAGSPTPPTNRQPQYSAAWRRALCSTHAPEFSAMMPSENTVKVATYDDKCIVACLQVANEFANQDTATPLASLPVDLGSAPVLRIGNLYITSWGSAPLRLDNNKNNPGRNVPLTTAEFPYAVIPPSGFSCVRQFVCAGDMRCSLFVETFVADSKATMSMWRGYMTCDTESVSNMVSRTTLGELTSTLFDKLAKKIQQLQTNKRNAKPWVLRQLAGCAGTSPIEFLGISRSEILPQFAENVPGYNVLYYRAMASMNGVNNVIWDSRSVVSSNGLMMSSLHKDQSERSGKTEGLESATRVYAQ